MPIPANINFTRWREMLWKRAKIEKFSPSRIHVALFSQKYGFATWARGVQWNYIPKVNGNGSISSRGQSPRDEDPMPFTQGMQFHFTPRADVAKSLSHGLLYNGILGLKFIHKEALSMMFFVNSSKISWNWWQKQWRRKLWNFGEAQGGYIFLGWFLLQIWAIWENDPY